VIHSLCQWVPYLLPSEWFKLLAPSVLGVVLAVVVGRGLYRIHCGSDRRNK